MEQAALIGLPGWVLFLLSLIWRRHARRWRVCSGCNLAAVDSGFDPTWYCPVCARPNAGSESFRQTIRR